MTSPDTRAAGLRRVEGLLDLLVCPQCHSRLVVDVDADELLCTGAGCGLAYPVTEDGVPVLLVDQARAPEPPAAPEPAAAPEEQVPGGHAADGSGGAPAAGA